MRRLAFGVLSLSLALGCSDGPPRRAGSGGAGVAGAAGAAGAGGAGQGGAGQAGNGGAPLGPTCDEAPDPHCDHPIDRVLLPQLRGAGIAIREASPGEHCRRLAIDLIGRGPTPGELATCTAAAPRARPAIFQAHEEHARHWGRLWGERIGYDDQYVWYAHLVELDAMVRALARGELRYGDFAGELVMHPGFYARHQGNDWSATVISLFLGRNARADELAGMRLLWQVFGARVACDGAVWWNFEQQQPGTGDEPGVCEKIEQGLNFCACSPEVNPLGCRSSTLGEVDLGGMGCRDPQQPFDERNLLRFGDRSLGQRTTCPGGRPGCPDRIVDGMTQRPTQAPTVPLPQVSAAERDRLLGVGRALAARGDFWEAAVDRELRRLLGWWQSGVRRPDWDLPAVRRVLAEELRRSGSLAAIEALITSSLLYLQPALADGAGDRPPWALGPTKLLAAEAWLDSAGAAIGEALGRCDYRFFSFGYVSYDHTDPTLIEHLPSSLGMGFDEQAYIDLAFALGGCSTAPRPTQSSLSVVAAQRLAAQLLCAVGRDVRPTGFDAQDGGTAALEAAARHVALRTTARTLEDAEATALGAEMRACLDAGAQGCETPEAAVRWACQRFLSSAEFGLY